VPQDQPPDRDWWTHRAETFDVEHTDGVFIVAPDGHWRVAVPGMPDVSGLPRRLTALLNDEGRSNMRHPDFPWTVAQLEADLWGLMGVGDATTASRPAAPPTIAPSASPAHVGRLVDGSTDAFRRRLAALRGRPVVVNEWASWCPPCQQEMPLMAAAAERYSPRVAFVGLDVNDSDDDARAFLAQHPLPFATYADPHAGAAQSLASFVGLPTTVFLDAAGRVQFVHSGAYADAASLTDDIQRHALG
jgi:thiol-disulfide isomerase/thioredoxin